MPELVKTKEPSRNTPKRDPSGNQLIPGNFEIITFALSNASDKNLDIRNLVDSFSITEELFSPVVTFTATLRDTENFFETFPLVGQERLIINIVKNDPVTGKRQGQINHTFYIKEYPNFTRTLDFPAVQLYTMVAISDFAYSGSLFTICRSVKGNTADNLIKILKDDLGIKNVKTDRGETKCKSDFEGIITIQTPLKAAEWLRSRCFDSDGSPFFLFNKLSEKETIQLYSWKYISQQPEYSKFTYRQFINHNPGTAEAYSEEITRILSMKSNLRLDRLDLAKQGAYANRLNVTDYASKAFYTRDFDSSEGKKSATGDFKSLWFKVSTPKGTSRKQLNELPTASISNLQVNTAKAEGSKGNSSTTALLDNTLFAKSFLATMNSENHEISVYGDTKLNPGVKIRLIIPKADREATTDTVDESLSGEYIITVSSHTFIEGIYINRLKLVKNILAVGKTSSGNVSSSSSGATAVEAYIQTATNRLFGN